MMPRTYEPIASTTLGSAAASVTFGSGGTLPQTYTDLILVTDVKSSHNSNVDGGCIRFNGDTGSNYSITRLAGSGTAATSDRQSSATTPIVRIAGNTASASTPVIYHIMSYSSSSVNKTALVTASESQTLITKGVLLWRSTAAITSLVVFPENGANFNSGSTFSLYGIKAA
jgi:hypothetical protein